MGQFTKEAMLDELRAIFLFTADLIMLGAGTEAAEQFIGLSYEKLPGDSFCHAPAEWVDLSRFPVVRRFEQAYEFAFRPSVLTDIGGDDIMDLMSFMLAAPRSGGVGCSEEHHAYMSPEGLCRTTVDLAWARWCLGGYQEAAHTTFTTRQLALLANMSEGAVRNALADKSENGLKAIPGSKPVAVDLEEARRWLKGRRGFVPDPGRASEDPVVAERLAAVRTTEQFASLIRQCARVTEGLSYEDFIEANRSWTDGTFAFDPAAAQALATTLDLDGPLFTGKALEVSLRRDAGGQP